MSMNDMAGRCPAARSVGWGKLKGWQLIINTDGWPTIVRNTKATLYGGLWTVTPDDESALDHYEGVSGGCFSRQKLVIKTQDDQRLPAFVYLAANSRQGEFIDEQTAKSIFIGAAHFRLPIAYMRYLKYQLELSANFILSAGEHFRQLTTEDLEYRKHELKCCFSEKSAAHAELLGKLLNRNEL